MLFLLVMVDQTQRVLVHKQQMVEQQHYQYQLLLLQLVAVEVVPNLQMVHQQRMAAEVDTMLQLFKLVAHRLLEVLPEELAALKEAAAAAAQQQQVFPVQQEMAEMEFQVQ